MLLAEESGWEATPTVLEAATTPFKQVGGSEIVEDGFRVLRTEEQLHSGFSKKITNKRKWNALIDSGTEAQVHHYIAAPWRGQEVPRGAILSFLVGSIF